MFGYDTISQSSLIVADGRYCVFFCLVRLIDRLLVVGFSFLVHECKGLLPRY